MLIYPVNIFLKRICSFSQPFWFNWLDNIIWKGVRIFKIHQDITLLATVKQWSIVIFYKNNHPNVSFLYKTFCICVVEILLAASHLLLNVGKELHHLVIWLIWQADFPSLLVDWVNSKWEKLNFCEWENTWVF